MDMSGGVVRISLINVLAILRISVWCTCRPDSMHLKRVVVCLRQGAYGQWSVIQAKDRADADAGVEVKSRLGPTLSSLTLDCIPSWPVVWKGMGGLGWTNRGVTRRGEREAWTV